MICSACGAEHERVNQRRCLACHAAYMRDWRRTHDMSEEQRYKDSTRSYANVYKRRGLLVQKPCAKCGEENSQMHHEDYDYPLDVVWLCIPCHLELHRNETEGEV